MLDFMMVSTRSKKGGYIEIYPKFIVGNRSKDLMIRGRDFYAIWVEELGLWSTQEDDAISLIDRELDLYYEKNKEKFDGNVRVLHMWDSESGMIDNWHKYCQKQLRDSFKMLDETLIFSNQKTTRKDYASKKLSYPLVEGDYSAYDKLMSVLYSPEERKKLEWAIGAIVNGDSRKLQKFLVMYGAAGTGKSTVLNIVQKLFDGYYSVFDAKALGSSSGVFALESFRSNPLVGIQHDGDLSRIEDNTRLNSLVSHEEMTVNEKFKATYTNRFKCFLFIGTNKPVKITDAKSGLLRRLIDVSPTGNKIPVREYNRLMKEIDFELGAIAWHCKEVYEEDPRAYDDYIPTAMLDASNDFYNFIGDLYFDLVTSDSILLTDAWKKYDEYCTEAKVGYPLTRRAFKEELKNYFYNYEERATVDGKRVRNYYSGFRTDRFEKKKKVDTKEKSWLIFSETPSKLDEVCKDCPAQYANEAGTPGKRWAYVKTTLKDISTNKLHYVKPPGNLIVIDFDLKNKKGEKDFKKNLKEAEKWPKTYAELSKSGAGIHLHYFYEGDVNALDSLYSEDVEIKVFPEDKNSSLRRQLTKCNELDISTISSGLPVKGEKVVNRGAIKSENGIRRMILKNLNKEVHGDTRSSIDFINKILDDAYNSDISYDVSDLKKAVTTFAAHSTHQAEYCLDLVPSMKFKSKDFETPFPPMQGGDQGEKDVKIIFFDVEIYPNLFILCHKMRGEDKPVIRMINPSPNDISTFLAICQDNNYGLVGFNCRKYDNHILYARAYVPSPTTGRIGYSTEDLYNLSQAIINSDRKDVMFGNAYNLSYTDIYDFSSKKQSLKKFEIELGIHHMEMGIPWDQPVDESAWDMVADYCANDVIATEKVFEARYGDFLAREILAALAGMTVNDTTNTLTTRIIFGNNKGPADGFNYRNLALPVGSDMYEYYRERFGPNYIFRVFDGEGNPTYETYKGELNLPDGWSILPFFPGYSFNMIGKKSEWSTYREEGVGEGGYVYAEPGMYGNVALLDIASMHPTSAITEMVFGSNTKTFADIREARIAIKHKDFDKARSMLDGKLAPFLEDESKAGDLANALKIAINSVYGLTSASFSNPFRDPQNKDNIVAKRGALFMINLKHEVQKRGFVVAHIKTDSIKIPDATPEIIQFVMEYGKEYGYSFEHEATYDRMCLVNDAVYIAKYKDREGCMDLYGYIPGKNLKSGGKWDATGAEFQVPYIFKKLFSKEPIEFEDLCETKSVKSSLYLDMNEGLPEGEHAYHFVGRVGQFCPIKPGCGGGELLRTQNDKYYAVTGTKGYRWMESEMVKNLGKEDDIDISYYEKLVDDARKDLIVYGDCEWFLSDDPYVIPNFVPDELGARPDYPAELPWN